MSEKQALNRKISNNTISVTASFVFFLLTITVPQPFLQPILIYDYEPSTTNIWIKNNGFQPATDVIIEVIPLKDIKLTNATAALVSDGILISEYLKNDNKIFHVQQLYNKDNLGITLSSEQKISDEDIKIIIRSNEVIGIEAEGFWQDLITNLQIMLLGIAIVFGIVVYFFVSWVLQKYQNNN
ncbi:hypothetical protein [Nitrosopumilus ureiphilus]|uniref:Uncharacterized protein n=1 Tax=Nitrosopumilus ureiphilus TaxID=1470067 RepID=A0A7D5M3U1_9ARCH|nr:hypothetical protein [Nitrosopumilus ureiphilus]QLH06012.1 hypothetical protein C5F50_02160 [Nitrosopumilus ureiphilus]